MKICTQCEFSLNTAWFRTEPRTKEGLQSVCRMCESLWRKGYREQPEVDAARKQYNSKYSTKHKQINSESQPDAEKTCYKCGHTKSGKEFASAPSRRGGLRAECKECGNNRSKQIIEDLKDEVFYLLGDGCKRCAFTDRRALQIDHVFGGGNKEHAEIKNNAKFLKKVIAEHNTGAYQILCANCNWIKRAEKNENPVGPRASA